MDVTIEWFPDRGNPVGRTDRITVMVPPPADGRCSVVDSPSLALLGGTAQLQEEESSGFVIGAGIAVAALGTAATIFIAKKCLAAKENDGFERLL